MTNGAPDTLRARSTRRRPGVLRIPRFPPRLHKPGPWRRLMNDSRRTRNPWEGCNMQPTMDEHPGLGPGRGRLEGKIVVVTGADSGIGRATARLFAREGARVVCVDIRETGN